MGAYQDRGESSNCGTCGAVYLFGFNDDEFSSGTLVGRVGHGYVGPNDVDLSGILENGDLFGNAVSLNGNGLAVGAWQDDGASNACLGCGAVYLFNFAAPDFGDGVLVARIGAGYVEGDDIDLEGRISPRDWFGISVSLEGSRLAVGALQDDGVADGVASSGAVYVFNFEQLSLSGGSLVGRIGYGYDVDLSGALDVGDNFGVSVSLDSGRLAVGARNDLGATNGCRTCGAVYLFDLIEADFSSTKFLGRIGSGYTGDRDINLGTLESNDYFGAAVSIDGNRLAVGARGDDGTGASCIDCGSVFLFNFSDSNFSGGKLAGIIGHYHWAGKFVSLIGKLDSGDGFGNSVSLDGTRLAVGAPGDDGATNSCSDCGAVYLFTFADMEFSGGTLAGRIGDGYTGAKDVNLAGTVGFGDDLGSAVSLDGTRLAVGAPYYNGPTYACLACGAVYLFTFLDNAFSGGTLAGRIGNGYTGGNNVDLAGTLGRGDLFGHAVSLHGTRLAVGALFDDGATNACVNCGAVYLFTFTDTAFSYGTLAGRIGDGYTGGYNINLAGTLGQTDLFGHAVSLHGTRLAVGALLDDGATNSCIECGAVYLFTFADMAFAGGASAARIGDGYTGGNNVNLAGTLGIQDLFGAAISLDGTRLAVGATRDEGAGNGCFQCGAVYLFTLGDGTSLAGNVAYENDPSEDVTISPSQITALLNAGTSVVLQASNDITVSNAITAANPGGDGGALTLQAGRSIFINANIFTDNGDLTLIANDLLANGVVDAYRDLGAAVISMATGTTINAGAGNVLFDLRSGAGKTNSTGGAITLTSVTASSITAQNTAASNGDIVLASGGVLNATGTGNAVVLAASDQFLNNAGAGAITTTPTGRFVIYSQNWSNDVRGGLTGSNLYNRTYSANPPASLTPTGNLFVYSAQPILTVTANAASRTYGAANPAFSASITGLVNGDSAGYAYAGAAGFSTTTTASSNVGTYVGDILPNIGTLMSSVGYGFNFAGGNLTINPAALTISANDASKRFGQTLLFAGTEFTTTGLLFADTVTSVSLSSLGAQRLSAAGTYAITPSAAVGLGLSNYTIAYIDGTLTVTGGPRPWVPQPVGGTEIWPSGDVGLLVCGVGALAVQVPPGSAWALPANDNSRVVGSCSQ